MHCTIEKLTARDEDINQLRCLEIDNNPLPMRALSIKETGPEEMNLAGQVICCL